MIEDFQPYTDLPLKLLMLEPTRAIDAIGKLLQKALQHPAYSADSLIVKIHESWNPGPVTSSDTQVNFLFVFPKPNALLA